MYNERVIITFGGEKLSESDHVEIDNIYYIDIVSDDGWIECELKVPKKGLCEAVLIDDEYVHIIPSYDYYDHFIINIDDLLPNELLKK